jgi:hypothetical protein
VDPVCQFPEAALVVPRHRRRAVNHRKGRRGERDGSLRRLLPGAQEEALQTDPPALPDLPAIFRGGQKERVPLQEKPLFLAGLPERPVDAALQVFAGPLDGRRILQEEGGRRGQEIQEARRRRVFRRVVEEGQIHGMEREKGVPGDGFRRRSRVDREIQGKGPLPDAPLRPLPSPAVGKDLPCRDEGNDRPPGGSAGSGDRTRGSLDSSPNSSSRNGCSRTGGKMPTT